MSKIGRRQRTLVGFLTALIVAGGLIWNGLHQQATAPPEHTSQTQQSQSTQGKEGSALAALSKLAIKGRAPKTGYSREQFSNGWADAGACDVRNKILQRDLTNIRTKSSTNCTVLTGTLNDPYTGHTIQFVRGTRTSSAIQIDHIVAISDAWQTGAQQLSKEARKQLYNDPLELLAVDGPTNDKKGDGDAATWLPPNKAYRCQYVASQVAVKLKYNLWVTAAEHDAISRVLASCSSQILPAGQ